MCWKIEAFLFLFPLPVFEDSTVFRKKELRKYKMFVGEAGSEKETAKG